MSYVSTQFYCGHCDIDFEPAFSNGFCPQCGTDLNYIEDLVLSKPTPVPPKNPRLPDPAPEPDRASGGLTQQQEAEKFEAEARPFVLQYHQARNDKVIADAQGNLVWGARSEKRADYLFNKVCDIVGTVTAAIELIEKYED